MNKVRSSSLNGVKDATHIMLHGLPRAATSRDVYRAILQTDVKGVSEVSLQYRHFRPTGAAILTMSLPDYTRNAVLRLQNSRILGVRPEAEAIASPQTKPRNSNGLVADGDGPSAGVIPGRTVTLYGLPGKVGIDSVHKLVKDFKLDSRKTQPAIQVSPLPERKFTLFSRFCIHLDSESEAQRLVRRLHMTNYKDFADAPLMKAEIIY